MTGKLMQSAEQHETPLAHLEPEGTFLLRSPGRSLTARGIAAVLPAGTAATLGERVRNFFAENPHGPRLLLGALPFDLQQEDYLVQPLAFSPTALLPVVTLAPAYEQPWTVTAEPDAAGYSNMVARALEFMRSPPGRAQQLDKVVLARRLAVHTDKALDPAYLASRLARDPAVTAFIMPLPSRGGLVRHLVGGTPELLVARQGLTVRSNPLAGSARRSTDPVLDRQAAEALLASDKDQREHAMVVEEILDNLAPYCEQLQVTERSVLQSTASMWHLGSKIEGRLRSAETSSAELAACLHPTPAVAGFPRHHAQQLIHELEPFERDFYAGAIGWTDEQGDGEWYVSLRCGEICGNQVLLYAGAGIVEGSDPQAEAEETSGKFMALLNALGIDEHGRRVAGVED
ncbi:MAG TPA: isochorismate synthase [Pseudohongiella sp.]|nr:isochorismate synthase [Pseudohongiella sp.]